MKTPTKKQLIPFKVGMLGMGVALLGTLLLLLDLKDIGGVVFVTGWSIGLVALIMAFFISFSGIE